MPKVHHIIKSFNAGELSPLMDARSDQEKYAFGCRTMTNFIPLIYGGAERRPGTQYIAGCTSNSAKSRLVAFEHSVDNTYILEFGNQTMRVFTGGTSPTPVYKPYGTEDLSAFDSTSGDSSLIAHWKFDDNAANTTVADSSVAGTHTGTATSNTNTISTTDESGTANKAFDLNDTDYVTVNDHANLTFGDGSTDSPFTFTAWVNIPSSPSSSANILGKYTGLTREYLWVFNHSSNWLELWLYDESVDKQVIGNSDAVLTAGWHFVAVTYNGNIDSNAVAGDDIAVIGMQFYIDFVPVAGLVKTYQSGYVAMEDTAADLELGSANTGSLIWEDSIHNIALFNKVLSAAEIASLTGNDSTTVYSITTPYLTADLFDLKFEQSADVMYITHPDYEPRKLLRYGNAAWVLEALDLQTGPFLDINTNTNYTITPSAITGSITLTATGFWPFKLGTTAGHLPSGSTATSKSRTGALFKIVQPLATGAYNTTLTDNYTNDPTENTSWLDCGTIANGVTWYLTTLGTWTGTLEVQRNYTIGAAAGDANWESVLTFQSNDDRNAETSAEETIDEADYRCILTASGDAAETCKVYFRISDTDHVGIVEITAVTNSYTATATVLKTLADTSATHRWAEGAFSNYRGWPIDVTISAEERLTFTGSASFPLTTWGSASGDFTDFLLGTDDDSAITFTLVGTGQQNRIRWVVPKDALIIGTVGGVHLLGASKDDEALTPSNVRARLQTTKGSENISPQIINQAVLFVERGGLKIRELLYDYESDSHKADDLTVFANHITGTGITDMAYQRTPEPILWCVRSDGEMAVMSYERDQKVFAWTRFVTTDGTSDSDFESVAVIYGGANSEDEVWVTVKRTINSATVRYIERFKTRSWGSNDNDAFFVDSGITYDSTSTTTITGLSHLEGETVQVYADGAKQTSQTVSSGQITLETAASTVQVGLGYTSTLQPMKLDIQGLGRSATMKITRGVVSLYKTMRGEWGENTDRLNPFRFIKAGQTSTEFPMFTGDIEMEFQSGYNRTGDIVVRQTDPLPMTVVALTLDVGVEND